MTPERLDEIRQHLSCSVSRSTDWWEQACRELLEHLDHPAEPPGRRSDPEEYRRLEAIRGWQNRGLFSPHADPVRYLLDLLDGRDRLLHDLSLDAQWAADAERGRIAAWLRERAGTQRHMAGSFFLADALRMAAGELESQGTPEPLPVDHLRKRVAELERALRDSVEMGDKTSGIGKWSAILELLRKALEGGKT